jgi:hypothetical protein
MALVDFVFPHLSDEDVLSLKGKELQNTPSCPPLWLMLAYTCMYLDLAYHLRYHLVASLDITYRLVKAINLGKKIILVSHLFTSPL